jgi:hypothetical protein
MKRRLERGASTIEMTLVGIPVIFTLISIFEISRGMWLYHTSAHAVKEGVRFAIVHGRNCDPASGLGNNCIVTVAQIAEVIRQAGAGLELANTTLTFTAPSGATITCLMRNTSTPSSGCDQNASQWPPSGDNGAGTVIQIRMLFPFRSALAMFWPGAGSVSFATVNLGASSADIIQF